MLVVLAAASSVEGEEGSYGNDRDFDMSPRLELGINRPMHSMWGARETDERGTYKELPQGAKLKISADQLKEVFDLQQDPLESMAADATAQSEDFVDDVLSDIVGGMGPEYAKRRAVGMGATKSAQSKHREHRRLKQGQLPSEGRPVKGQVLSPLGQQEEGVNPRGQPCPNYGLDQSSFLVVGGTQHYWTKTVEIRFPSGKLMGTVKRGCPAWTESFVWRVPEEHALGCRDDVDPNVFTSTCQIPEVEVLYTDEWSGLLHPNEIKIRDCHDDLIFRLYEEKKQVIVHDYMIRSDFVVESKNRTIMGYCRQDRLPGRALARVGDHNFSIVDMDGEVVASATRPVHWPNGATEHIWNVTISQPSVPGTISDVRVVAVAVLNNVLLHEQDDWCSDIVFMLTPILLTLLGIAIIIVISTCMSWFHSTEVGKKWYYSTGGSAKHLSTNGKAEDMRKLKSAKW